ncbi:phage-related minor tail protein [Microbacterium sp. AG157]|uniref:phage tail tape measure protein n=1 Tax=Microbacterium sp. AG157 TaxID=2183993 RepID=UPI000E2750FF|nr:phage tail tape measure protein [Microbacterium sp. AG157]REC98326.1 phage-related minor tail protein [Microbacterium sp. AG157]
MAGKSATDLIIRLLVEDESLDKVDRSKAKFDAWNDALEQGSKVAAGTLLAVGGLAVGTTIAFADAEAGVDSMAGALKLTEPEASRAGEAAANAYGRAFGGSLDEVQSATAGVIGSIKGMRDASVAELQGITEGVLTLSGGFELEADRVSQIVGQMLSTGMASSAQEGIDLLTVALQRVPPAVRDDLLDAIDEYGPFFQQLGISGETAFTMLADASAKGMYGIDKTGDALKEFTIRSTDMSTSSGAAYEALGLSQTEMTNKILAGGDSAEQAFAQIIMGLNGMTDPAAQSQAALALFGTPLEDLGTGEIPKFLDQLANLDGGFGDVAGAAAAMADTVSGNTKGSWESIRRDLQMTAAEIGESFAPAVSDGLEVLRGFADWAGENQGVVTAIASVVGVLAGAVVLASGAMKVFAAAQAIQTAAQWASNAAWLASPITWIILGIIAAVVLLVAGIIWLASNWDSVISWLGSAWSWLWDNVLSPVFSAIGAAFEWLGANVFAPIGSFIATVVQGIGDVFNWLYQNIILPVVTGIMLYIGLWAAVIVWLWENVAMPVFDLIGQGLQWLYQNVFVPVGQGIDAVIRGIGDVLNWIGQNVFAPFGQFVADVIRNVGNVFSWLHANVVSPVGAAIGAAVNAVGSVFSWLWNNAIMPAVNGIGQAVQWVYNSVISPVFNAISGAVDMVGNAFRTVFGAIGGFISNAFSGAVNAVRGPINAIIGLVNGAIRAINGISVTIPAWVPIVGGQTFGVSLPQVPYLATGGVTMGPMLAVVGDNPGGREYIEPVDKVATRMERVALEAAASGRAAAPGGLTRLAREDLELVAQLIGQTVYPLIVKGAQSQIKTALGV